MTMASFSVIIFHIYNFVRFYKLNKQVERILQTRTYQRNQDVADELDANREKIINELSRFKLEKERGRYIRVQEIPESDVEII